jgi:hypothetical protein
MPLTNAEMQTLINEIDKLHARRDRQSEKLQRTVEAHGAADQERKRLLDSDVGGEDARLVAATRLTADARLAADTAREALAVTQSKLDEASQVRRTCGGA